MNGRLRARLLKVLEQRANSHGEVVGTADEIRRELGIARHDLTKALYDLKALGKLTFTEVKTGTQTHASRIQLRDVPAATRKGPAYHQAEILAWLGLHGGQNGSAVPIVPALMASDIGISYHNLMTNLRVMAGRGDLDIQYQGHGARSGLKSIRVLPWVPKPAAAAVEVIAAPAVRVPTDRGGTTWGVPEANPDAIDFRVVSDALRVQPRPEGKYDAVLKALAEDQTVFLPGRKSTAVQPFRRRIKASGFLHARNATVDGSQGVVLWLERKETTS